MFRLHGITSIIVSVMSKDLKVVLDIHGINELMKSEWMQEILNEQAEGVVERGAQMGVTLGYRTHLGSFTAITDIYPDDKLFARKCADAMLLEAALFGGGDDSD